MKKYGTNWREERTPEAMACLHELVEVLERHGFVLDMDYDQLTIESAGNPGIIVNDFGAFLMSAAERTVTDE